MCYIAGRVHQFFKQTNERELAYRDGYNTATRSLFSLATRTAKGAFTTSAEPATCPKPAARPAAKPVSMRGYASVPEENRRARPARHRASGRRERGLADTKHLDLNQAA